MKSKKNTLLVLGSALAFVGTAVAVQQFNQTQQRMARAYRRWHPITVNRDIADVVMDSDELLPLMDLGGDIEIRIEPAPGGRGTEIAARLITSGDMTDKSTREMLRKLREALRNTQWLLETGEILLPDSPPSTRRTPTSLPLQFATRHAREGGRL
jgi:hypothetical protein